MPRPDALQAAQRFRVRLAGQEAEAAERMGRIYASLQAMLTQEIEGLAEQMALMDEAQLSKAIQMNRLKLLLGQVEEQAARFGVVVQAEVSAMQTQALEQGIADAMALMDASLPALPPEIHRQVVRAFTRLHPDAIEAMAGLLGPDSPLVESLETNFGVAVREQVEKHLLDGITVGQNPCRIARLLTRNVRDSLGNGLTWALRTVRTAQLSSYRLASHATYAANPNVVKGWVWHAELGSSRTCMGCIAKHGTVHPIDETLRDHHNGRCAPIPLTVTYRDLGLNIDEPTEEIEKGEDWFKRQPQTMQRQLMGGAMHDAYRAGKFRFGDLSRPYDDPIYGQMWREATLKALLGEPALKKAA